MRYYSFVFKELASIGVDRIQTSREFPFLWMAKRYIRNGLKLGYSYGEILDKKVRRGKSQNPVRTTDGKNFVEVS